MDTETLSITTQGKGRPPRLPFLQLKDKILGKKFELSILFATKATSKKLNMQFRGKNKPTNILSFEYSKTSGEIVIQLDCVKKDAPKFGLPYTKFLGFLFIHGLLHLKGMEHGAIMERHENKWRKEFGYF